MADDNKEPVKQEIIRDEQGKFIEGVSGNPNGRPKKGLTLTDIAREVLEEAAADGSPKTRKELLMRKVVQLAYDGNETMIKLVWNYIDGLPVQKTEISGIDGGAIEIDTNTPKADRLYSKFIELMEQEYGTKQDTSGS